MFLLLFGCPHIPTAAEYPGWVAEFDGDEIPFPLLMAYWELFE